MQLFPLILQTVSRLPELAPTACQGGGCRGFTGPIPPPLWMSPVIQLRKNRVYIGVGRLSSNR